jgi:hypothetical protein
MQRPTIIEERIGVEPMKYPSFIEFNKSGTRLRIAFDGADPEGALDLIDEGLGIRAYGINAFMIHLEKITKEK